MVKDSPIEQETQIPGSESESGVVRDEAPLVDNEKIVEDYITEVLDDPIVRDEWRVVGSDYIASFVTDVVEERVNLSRGGMNMPQTNSAGEPLYTSRNGPRIYDDEESKRSAYDVATRLVAVRRDVNLVSNRKIVHVESVDQKEEGKVITKTTNYELINRYDQFTGESLNAPQNEQLPLTEKDLGSNRYLLRNSNMTIEGETLKTSKNGSLSTTLKVLKNQPRALAEVTINSTTCKADEEKYYQGYVDSGYLISDLSLKRVSRSSCNEILPELRY